MSSRPVTGDRRGLLKDAIHRLDEMQAKLDEAEWAASEPIAIIGIGCRFPGGAHDPATFWQMLCEGRDGICEAPPDRADIHRFCNPEPGLLGRDRKSVV